MSAVAFASLPIESPSPCFVRPPAGGEGDFLDRLRAGDEQAFEDLVRAQGGRLLAVAQRFLRSSEDSADAVQEAFLSAFRSLDSFKANSALSTWLHRILVNICLMKLRSRSRRRESPVEDLLPRLDQAGRHAGPVRRWMEDPLERLAAEEARQVVRKAIQRLPDPLRVVFLLRDIEELNTAETAELLVITQANVKTRLHRARRALRAFLEPDFGSRQQARGPRAPGRGGPSRIPETPGLGRASKRVECSGVDRQVAGALPSNHRVTFQGRSPS